MGGEFGGEWVHVYVWLGSFAVHLKLSQHCMLVGYTPVQNKKFKKKTLVGAGSESRLCYLLVVDLGQVT